MVYTEKRPWGRFELYGHNELSTTKLIYVDAGKRLSLQYHNKREEEWKIISGTGIVYIGDKEIRYKEGDTFKIPVKALHRISASTNTVFLEIARGNFDENDIVRIEDDFHRK